MTPASGGLTTASGGQRGIAFAQRYAHPRHRAAEHPPRMVLQRHPPPTPPTPGPGAIGMLTLLCCHVLILSAPTPLLCAPCPAARATRAQPFRELAASSPFGAVSADTKGTTARHTAGSRTANLHKEKLHAERECVPKPYSHTLASLVVPLPTHRRMCVSRRPLTVHNWPRCIPDV